MMYESLESRRLLAGDEPFSPAARLIGLDRLLSDFPQLSGAGQAVAVIDTGIDYTHPLLGGGFGPDFKVIGGHDFVDDDDDPIDTDGHGTSIAGIIAGDELIRDGILHRAVAPDAK